MPYQEKVLRGGRKVLCPVGLGENFHLNGIGFTPILFCSVVKQNMPFWGWKMESSVKFMS